METYIIINKEDGLLSLTEDDLFDVGGNEGTSDLNFIEGANIVISRNGSDVTISSTASGEGADGNNYPTALDFNTSNGILTISRNGLPDITEAMDGRYLTSVPAQSWSSITGKPSTFAPSAHNHDDLYVRKTGGTYTGNVYAPKFFQTSLRELKMNIKPFVKDGLALIDTLDIVEYDYKTGEENNIGVIADDTSVEFLSNEKDAVNLYNTIFIQAKAIQELKGKVEFQEERLLKLEKLVEKLSK